MTIGVKAPALLSKSQLDQFRSQLAQKHDAMFLAPQLLEQVSILTRHLKVALGQLEGARGLAADLERAAADRSRSGEACPACHDAELLSALRQLRAALGQE